MSEPENEAAQIANLRGDMKEGFAAINGRIDALIGVVQASNDARVSEVTELRRDGVDYESRLRQHDRDINSAMTRVAHVEATAVTAKKLWTVVLGGIAAASAIFTIIASLSP